jgi:PilZ domain
MEERRSSKRWSAALKARIVFNNRSSALDCTVRNLSDSGAGISFAGVSPISTEFELEIPNRSFQVHNRLVWNRGANHGVMFWQKAKAWTNPTRTHDGRVIPFRRNMKPSPP